MHGLAAVAASRLGGSTASHLGDGRKGSGSDTVKLKNRLHRIFGQRDNFGQFAAKMKRRGDESRRVGHVGHSDEADLVVVDPDAARGHGAGKCASGQIELDRVGLRAGIAVLTVVGHLRLS